MIGPSDYLKRFITQAPPGDVWIDCLEFTHPAWAQGVVVATYHVPIEVTFETGRRVTTLPLAFRVDLPDAGTDGRQDMSITLDNVGIEMWSALEQAQSQPQFPIVVTWRCYTAKTLGYPQAYPVSLTVTGISLTTVAVQLQASRTDMINRRWPRTVYRSERWPGLVR